MGISTFRSRLMPLILCMLACVDTANAHDETRAAAETRRRQVDRLARAQVDEATARTPAAERVELTVTAVDQANRAPLPALVRVLNRENGKPLPLDGEIHRAENWYSLPPGAKLSLPRLALRIEAIHGLDRESGARDVDLASGKPTAIEIPLRRFADPAALGLRSGNTHLHLRALSVTEMDRYLRLVPRTDGLDLVFVSHLRRAGDDHDYITNSLTAGDLGRLSESGVLFGNGEEHRHNFGPGGEGYGHVMLLNIPRLVEPASIGPGIMKTGDDGRPLRTGIQQARRDGGTIIWCHNRFGLEDVPNWLEGLIHAQNINDGGPHGSYDETYYRYLDLGMHVPFSTGTDWFVYDFSRVYAPVRGPLTVDAWLQSLAAGRTFITNGPLLQLTVQEGENQRTLGDTVALDRPTTLRVMATGHGRLDFRGLELVQNGRVVRTEPARRREAHYRAEFELDLHVAEPGWLALRVPLAQDKNELGQTLFAHTSPIYCELGGKRIFRHAAADAMLVELRRALETIPKQGRFASDAQRDELLRLYRDAVERLTRMSEASR